MVVFYREVLLCVLILTNPISVDKDMTSLSRWLINIHETTVNNKEALQVFSLTTVEDVCTDIRSQTP